MPADFQWIEIGIKRPEYFQRNIFIKADELDKYRQMYNNTGIFATAYRYLSPERQGSIYAPYLYLDLDHPGLIEKSPAAWSDLRRDYLAVLARLDTYYNIKRPLVKAYFSGLKGLSILVPSSCFGLGPSENLNEIFRLIAEDITNLKPYWQIKSLDLAIYDRVRLWRLVNSKHENSGLYKIPISFEEIMSASLPVILNLAQLQRPDIEQPVAGAIPLARTRVKNLLAQYKYKGISANGGLDFEPPCITILKEQSIGQGNRNKTITALASYYLQRNLDQRQSMTAVLNFNKRCCTPPLPVKEVEQTVRSVFRHGYNFGCRTFREISICKPKECRFVRNS